MSKSLLAVLGVVVLLLILGGLTSVRGAAYTYVVNSTSDTDDGYCDPLSPTTECTLREAIDEAESDGDDSTIVFNVPITDTGYQVSGITGTWTISLTSNLIISNEGGTIISGTTQAGFIGGDPNPDGPEIEITGASMASDGVCLGIMSTDNVIHGLVINGCPWEGIWIGPSGADGNTVSGSYIGTDATGSSGPGNGRNGVSIVGGAQNNTIGGTGPGEGNVISLNGEEGLVVGGGGTDGNVVCGNYIGTDKSGTLDLGNAEHGVHVVGGAQENRIGPGNLIFGNDWAGVRIHGGSTISNTITENGIYNNDGLGIVLADGANSYIVAPTIDSANCVSISGTAPANSTVEVFTGPDDEGKTYLATSSADGGNWSVTGLFALDAYVTATATDAAGNTSEFSTAAVPGTCHQVFVPLGMKNYP